MNEFLFFASVIVYMSMALGFFWLFGKKGLYIWTGLAVVLANIEVLKLVEFFGLNITLGNALFGTSLLVTDLLSERYSRKDAKLAIYVGFICSLCFVLITQIWLLFTPAADDFVNPAFTTIFGMSPRIVAASMITYFITQHLDIKMYHVIWDFTSKYVGKRRLLWVRNNGGRVFSQALNCTMFNFLAFYKVFPNSVLVEIIIINFAVFMVIACLDTPFAYLGRAINEGVLIKKIYGGNHE